MEKDLADKIVSTVLSVSGELDESVKWVDESCSKEEATQYRRAIRTALTELLIGVLNPIWRAYPDLTPAGMTVPTGPPECRIHGQVGFSDGDSDAGNGSDGDESKN